MARGEGQALPGRPSLPDIQPGTHTWPALPEHDLARRLQAFAAGQSFLSSPAPQVQAPAPATVAEQMDMSPFAPTTVNADRLNVLQALSEHMATILHQQAMHHGIDLT
jgi:hypothetical protein